MMDHWKLSKTARLIVWIQGVYFVARGGWPVIHFSSFEAVTQASPSSSFVQTAGALVLIIGLALCISGMRSVVCRECCLLASGSAAALCASDIVFTTQQAIPPVYLLDAALQCLFLAAWITLGWLMWRLPSRARISRHSDHLAVAWR